MQLSMPAITPFPSSVLELETVLSILWSKRFYYFFTFFFHPFFFLMNKKENFDDKLTRRKVDNFQFVPFHKITSNVKDKQKKEAIFALHALQEIPHQYRTFKRLKMLN